MEEEDKHIGYIYDQSIENLHLERRDPKPGLICLDMRWFIASGLASDGRMAWGDVELYGCKTLDLSVEAYIVLATPLTMRTVVRSPGAFSPTVF
ncbi:hypothetical protein E2C01_055947 [Portunus trituberculatus]|uniref:Uncharacterized protein n=1 Tax=Portunus trituberculatus TaxID=210409 RepID=A0A5B7GNV6_PORTR|nr:hypothetical protein [Portunus trituberculatus]